MNKDICALSWQLTQI